MRRFNLISHIFILSILILTESCHKQANSQSEIFDRVDALCDSLPGKAIEALDNIRYESLSAKDRHRYDLLLIKSRDKAYVRHTSDSLILDVIGYYSNHKESGLYPEALYYGGRVYSDMGDLPTALRYFQLAIDATPNDKLHLRFKSKLLSQTGRLLEDLRLHNQGAHYITEAIEICRQLNDSVGLFYDNMQLVTYYINNDSLSIALAHLEQANKYVAAMSDEDRVMLKTKLALIQLHKGLTDSALYLIRPVIIQTDSLSRNFAMGIASEIYKTAGIYDTAFLYAKELVASHSFNNRINGFNILFSPEVSCFIPKDSITIYAQLYGEHIQKYRNKYEAQEALLQNSKYNYLRHDRQRDKAEKAKSQFIIIALIVGTVLIIIIFYLKLKNVETEMNLRMAIQIAENIESSNCQKTEITNNSLVSSKVSCNNQKKEEHAEKHQNQDLKRRLLEKLNNICDNNNSDLEYDENILQSTTVKYLHVMICNNEGIGLKNKKIWEEIEIIVHESSPEFKSRLETLTLGKMTDREYHVALLIRCGIIPKDIAILLNKTKSTITDRRRTLAKKIFGTAGNNATLDRLILKL